MNIPEYVIYGAIALAAILLIIVIVKVISGSKKDNEVTSSILDVDEVGVTDSKDFSYGYEKEETVVMNPIEENKEEKKEE